MIYIYSLPFIIFFYLAWRRTGPRTIFMVSCSLLFLAFFSLAFKNEELAEAFSLMFFLTNCLTVVYGMKHRGES